jgi:hypothetical protein
MLTRSTIRSWPAIGLGLFFAGVTGAVLFDDVLRGAPLGVSHLMSLAALVAAISAGHMSWPAIRSGAIVPGAMLAILAVSSTAYVVISSGARNAEQAGNKTAAIQAANAVRERELGQLAKAEAMHAEASKLLTKECASGNGTKCRGVRATVEVYEAAIRGHQSTLASLPAPKVANGYAHTARVLNSWGLAVTDEWLSLNMPFVIVLIAELGTIAFLHLGIGHARRPKPRVVEIPSVDVEPDPPGTREQAISWIKAYEAKHGHPPKLREIQETFHLPKTTAHRYRAAC